MQIFPNVYQISSRIADRNLFQYVFVGDNVVLLDTGFSSTPRDVIFPFTASIGLGSERITFAINTHADADHHGGNRAVKQECPGTLLCCGELDRAVIENPDLLFATRYNQWLESDGVGLGANANSETWVRQMTGEAQRIDVSFRGGEQIALNDNTNLQVVHLPGHSHGHLAVYSAANRAIFLGDALHGSACPSTDGKPSLPPAYFAVLAYLSSVQTVEALRVDWIYSAHWPVFHGRAAEAFLSECKSFVDRADRFLREELARHPTGATLRQCMDACTPALGRWPTDNLWLLMYPVRGHLDLLEEMGVVTAAKSNGVTRWKLR